MYRMSYEEDEDLSMNGESIGVWQQSIVEYNMMRMTMMMMVIIILIFVIYIVNGILLKQHISQ